MLQRAGEGDALSVLPTGPTTREPPGPSGQCAQQRSTHLPRCLFPPSCSLKSSAQAPWHGSSHPLHPHTCHVEQPGLLQPSFRLASRAFYTESKCFPPLTPLNLPPLPQQYLLTCKWLRIALPLAPVWCCLLSDSELARQALTQRAPLLICLHCPKDGVCVSHSTFL